MKQEIKDFVDGYNKVMDVNREILSELKDFVPGSTWTERFIRECVSTKKITEEDCDLENAILYTYPDGKLELQAFSNERCGITYFWLRLSDLEESYREREVNLLKENIDHRIKELAEEIVRLGVEMEECLKIKKGIS